MENGPDSFLDIHRLVENHSGGHLLWNVKKMADQRRTPFTTSMVLVFPPCFMMGM